MKKYLKLIFILSTLCLCACSVNPVTGKKQLNWVSDEQEIEMGKTADPEFKLKDGLYKDPRLQAYVEKVGQSVAKYSGRENMVYHFAVLDSPVINAFALPGGYIYVTRGILAQMNSEAELAFVLGHEIGHVAAKHGAQRMSQLQGASIGMSILALVLGKEANPYQAWIGKALELSILGYGRQNELEADGLGVQYASKSGYHLKAGALFLETLKKQEPYARDWLSQIHSSHPPTDERLSRVHQQIDTLEKAGDTSLKKIQTASFLSEIQGLFIGEAKAMGTLKDRHYQNDQFKFSLQFPASFKIYPCLQAPVVVFESPNEYRVSVNVTEIGQALKKTYPIKKREGGLYTVIQYSDPYEIQFQFSSFQDDFTGSQIKEIDSLMASFSPGVNGKAYRLIIHDTKAKESLSDIAKRYSKDPEFVQKLAAFNNLSPLQIPLEKIKIPPPF